MAGQEGGGAEDGDALCDITGTPEHPFWSLTRNGWVGLGELRRGEVILLADGEAVVENVATENLVAPIAVYNLEVEGWHTYFAARAWVHNKCSTAASASKGKRGEIKSGIRKNTTRIRARSGKRDYRVPDQMNRAQTRITEVKNAQRVGLTHQIQDDIDHVTRNGLKGKVTIIVNTRTRISQRLQEVVDRPNSPVNIVRRNLNR